MFYFFYDIFLILASMIYLPFYALRGRVHREILTRLGFFKPSYFQDVKGRDVVWIHAVSVGEARAAESLLRLIREKWPHKRIVVSTVTPTGQAIIKRLLKEDELAFYAPLDISFVVRRFLKTIAPGLLVIMETEIWPNLIRLAKKRGSSVVVVNGRISDRSYLGYKKIKPVLEPILDRIDLFCMQTDESARRIQALGADPAKVKMTGNIKFDISSDLIESSLVARLKKALNGSLLFIAASTHENEEEMMVDIYKSVLKDFNNLRLLIAPRHVERIDKIRRMIRLHGLDTIRLSRLMPTSAGQVMLLDTVGDLSALYRLCDVTFVGGSLVPKGGHNLIEPALFGKPIIFGRHMENFKEIRDVFVRENAAIEVDSPQNLEYELRRLLGNLSERKALGDRARSLLDKNRGAAQRTFSFIEEMIKR